jgi:hypothetical protein
MEETILVNCLKHFNSYSSHDQGLGWTKVAEDIIWLLDLVNTVVILWVPYEEEIILMKG